MAISANIIAKLSLGDDTYDVSLNIPSGTPSVASPYAFSVSQEVAGGTSVKLLDVLIGDATHFHVAIAPPQSVLSLAGGAVENLAIQVDENYNEVTGTFNP